MLNEQIPPGGSKREVALLRLQGVFDNILDIVLLADDEGHVLQANPAACSLLDLSREKAPPLTLFDMVPSQERESDRTLWQAVIAGGEERGEHTFTRGDGATFEIEYRIKANIVPGVHLLELRDVTTRKRAEEALRRERDLVRSILEASPDGIIISDLQGVITDCNPAACEVRAVAPKVSSLAAASLSWLLKKIALWSLRTPRRSCRKVRPGVSSVGCGPWTGASFP